MATPESTDKKQRNIRQTHQEREIIKTAPDMVVYLDGLPYLVNPYIGKDGTLVNFNDYVTAINGSCDVESYIPGATFTMSIPNAHKRLFMAPGGNRIISAMMDIRVFAKGYYPDPEGKTIYHRIFWGVVSSVTYTDTGSTLEIDVSCKGVMRLFELMQVNTAPGLIQVAQSKDPTPFKTTFYSYNAFLSAFYMFAEPIRMSILRTTSIKELTNPKSGTGGSTTDEVEAFMKGYAPKWGVYLRRLLKGLRFFPFNDKDKTTVFSKWAKGLKDETLPDIGHAAQMSADVTDADFLKETFSQFQELVSWTPDYAIGNITLFNSSVISRLERLRQMVDLIGYEGFQDLDGRIIIKPPLYNLDSTMWTPAGASDAEEGPVNPFVVHLAEIEQESEQEDETQIHFTRTQVKGTLAKNPLMQNIPGDLLAVSSWIDLRLLQQFGLRFEEPKSYSFLGEDQQTNFAWAVNEMTKSNRGYRSYQCSIPLRPELKLGYPIYLPHMDMYGYLRNISWSYNVGGTATMRLHLDCIRPRVLNKVIENTVVEDAAGNKTPIERVVYQSAPNLVFKFGAAETGTATPKERKDDTEGRVGTALAIDPKNSTPTPAGKSESKRLGEDFKKLMELEPTTPTNAWRITKGDITQDENDKAAKAGKKMVDFSKKAIVDSNYYYTLRTTIPYTDANGYVLLAPFPWGRHMGLRDALENFSMSSTEREAHKAMRQKKATGNLDLNQGQTQSKLNAFLFTALGTPSVQDSGGANWDAVYNGLLGVKMSVLGNDTGESADDDKTWFVMEFNEAGKDLTLASMASPASKEAESQLAKDSGSQIKSANLSANLVTNPGAIDGPAATPKPSAKPGS
jgi:hypothetical protein